MDATSDHTTKDWRARQFPFLRVHSANVSSVLCSSLYLICSTLFKMGRVGRYKKIKAFDPFSKTGGVVPEPESAAKADQAPKKNDRDRMPSKLRQMMSLKNKFVKPGGIVPKKESTGSKLFNHVQAYPGEKMRQFAKRVTDEYRKVKKNMKDSGQLGHSFKQVNEKRKAYLEGKREKKRARLANEFVAEDEEGNEDLIMPAIDHLPVGAALPGAGGKRKRRDSDDDFPAADQVTFGERVEAPPKLSAPRLNKAMRHKVALERAMAGVKAGGAGKGKERLDKEGRAEVKAKEAAELDRAIAVKSAVVDAERARARDAYAAMKAAKRDAFRAEGAAGAPHGAARTGALRL